MYLWLSHLEGVKLTCYQVHIRAHKGERVFKCEHPGCDSAGFFSRSNLVAHKKIHMSARNKWVCKLEGCTKSFSSTGNRKVSSV